MKSHTVELFKWPSYPGQSWTPDAGPSCAPVDTLGQMIEKSGNGGTTLLVYDEQGHLEGEYSSSGALIQETVWMDDMPVATLRPNGSTACTTTTVCIFYVHPDHLETPRKVTRPSDNGLMWRYDPDTFSSSTSAANQNPAGLGTFVYDLRFPGQYYLAESGLHYNYFRTYDPQMGRYLESDPVGLVGGHNTYAYVENSPTHFSDPYGLLPMLIGLPRTTSCKSEEKQECRERCAPKPMLGCYVTLSWKLKGVRANGPIRREVRTVNCRCQCDDDDLKKAAASVGAGTLIYWTISELSRLFPPRNLVPVP